MIHSGNIDDEAKALSTVGQSTATTLELDIAGPFAARLNGKPVRLYGRKARALLAYLALSDQPFADRTSLCGLLWSERAEVDAKNNLRQCLFSLQKSLSDFTGLDVRRDAVGLTPNTVQTDINAYLTVLADTELDLPTRRAKDLTEQLMQDLQGLDPAFDLWLHQAREQLHDRIITLLRTRMQDAATPRTRERAARALFQADPVNEPACRVLIEAALRSGDIPTALTHYQAIWTRMDAEFGEEPSTETQSLIIAFRQQPSVTAIPAAAIDPRPNIVFNNLDTSGLDPDLHRLAEGFRMDLLASLIRFREWRIFDGSDAASGQGYLMSAALQGTPEDLHLVATLKNGSDGSYLWSERLHVPNGSWMDMQRQIVRRLSVALNVHLAWDRADLIDAEAVASLQLYDQWLVGNRLFLEYELAKWDQAERIFHNITEKAPRFARAYSSLAGLQNARQLAFPGQFTDQATYANALGLSRKAVALDPIDNRTQLAMGWSNAMAGQFEQSALAFSLAHQHNENDPWTMISSAVGLAFCGETETARRMNARAIEINPRLTPFNWSYIATCRFLHGDYTGCVAASEQAVEVTPDVPAWHMAALALMGDVSEARRVCERFLQIASDAWAGADPACEPDIARWIATCFPIRDSSARHSFLDGLAASGLPLIARVNPAV